MKILIVCQHYWPEPYPLTDICEELVHRGHEVRVITDVPNYPMGYIYDGYKNGKQREQEHNGVRITRTFTIGRRHNVVFRLLNYFSYAISSTWYTTHLKEAYDVVFCNQTSPIMMVSAGLAYAKKNNKKSFIYCMDLWPASLAAGGMKESSPIYKIFGLISRRLYRRADTILITSLMFKSYLKEKFDITDEKIKYLPQYADSQFDLLPNVGKNKETVDFVFAGNIGAAQSLDTVINAAQILNKENTANKGNTIRWHIVGDGSELENLKKLAQKLETDNVIFHGRKPIENMPEYYAMADAMIISLTADEFISMTLPGKMQTYMAAGKPILASANGEIQNVIHKSKCGYCAKAGDSKAFAQAVVKFLECEDKLELGKNAKAYYAEHFTRKLFMDKLESELDNAVRKQNKGIMRYESIND